jgi:hypothetical protein
VSDGAARVYHVLGEQRVVPVEIMCVESVERMLDRHPRIAHNQESSRVIRPLPGSAEGEQRQVVATGEAYETKAAAKKGL